MSDTPIQSSSRRDFLKDSGRIAGCTRIGNIDRVHRRREIGWTWLGRDWWRTAVNTEAKLLLLRHAFGHHGCLRVELKTDRLNQRSRDAILGDFAAWGSSPI